MHLRSLLVAIAAMSVLATASVALAGPTTDTTHEHNATETFVDVLPNCDGSGDLYEITVVYNEIDHGTAFTDGRSHETFTQTGTFSAEPFADSSLPTYDGHFTIWGNFNVNGKTVNGTFTFNANGMGSDGSQLQHHETEHFNQRPDGTVQEFFRCH
jgi:hypothetical protein